MAANLGRSLDRMLSDELGEPLFDPGDQFVRLQEWRAIGLGLSEYVLLGWLRL